MNIYLFIHWQRIEFYWDEDVISGRAKRAQQNHSPLSTNRRRRRELCMCCCCAIRTKSSFRFNRNMMYPSVSKSPVSKTHMSPDSNPSDTNLINSNSRIKKRSSSSSLAYQSPSSDHANFDLSHLSPLNTNDGNLIKYSLANEFRLS